MKCETVEDLLLDFVEGGLDERQEEAVRSHVEGCGSCQFSLKETRDLLGVLDDAKRSQVSSRTSTRRGDSSVVMLGPASWEAGEALGDFEILGEIGRGGMGIVYRAKQVSLNRVVALKVLPGSVCQSTKAVARFQKEARAAAKLHHTNIVPVYAQGEHEGHFYYAMELIEGQSLDRVLRHDAGHILPATMGSSSVGETAAEPQSALTETTTSGLRAGYRRLALMIAGVAEGLAHAHQQGVVHRDIKPQNLLLGIDGLLHITDFGLARLLDEPSVTLSGEMLGTPAYMSPEQVGAHRNKIDHRTDIYSLGVTFYELLTRHRPFEGASREQIIARICTSEPRWPRKWNPSIPIDLETICLRAMEQDARRRYQSAADLAADLRRYAEDRPILSRRVGPVEKAVKWVRRHRALTAIIALSVLLVAGGTVWTMESVKARAKEANSLVQKAFDLLAYEDYRETARSSEWLMKARSLGADDLAYHKALALSCLLNDPKTAAMHLEVVGARQPLDTEAMYLLAWALRRDDQLNPKSREWLLRAKAMGGETTAAGQFFHAQAVIRYDPEEAVEAYRRALRQRANYTQALVHLGRAHNHWMYHHRKHERFSEQVECLKNACLLQPDKAYPRYLLSIAYRLSAEIYESAGNAVDAEAHYKLALDYAQNAQEVERDAPHGYVCEAEYWEKRGDNLRALAARERAAPYCMTSGLIGLHFPYYWRLCYWEGRHGQAMEALATLASTCPEGDAHKSWYLGLFPALVEAEQGRLEEALRSVRSVAENMPKDFRAVTGAACMLRLLGRHEEADQLLSDSAERVNFHVVGEAFAEPGWTEALYGFCQGRVNWADLTRAAGPREGDKLIWGAPHLFAAFTALGHGDRQVALDQFRLCELTYDYDDYSYLALVFVRKLEADPAWPAWSPAATPADTPEKEEREDDSAMP
jgi:serine/threonine protein kinase